MLNEPDLVPEQDILLVSLCSTDQLPVIKPGPVSTGYLSKILRQNTCTVCLTLITTLMLPNT